VTHEEALELIPAFLTSSLEGPALERLHAHLRDCERCAEIATGIGEVVETLRENGHELLDPHPDEKALRAYFEGRSSPEAKRIERHLRTCASCSLELSTKTWQPSPLRVEGLLWSRGGMPAVRLGVAAGLFALGLVLGVGLKAFWRGRGKSGEAPAISMPSWSGAVDLHLLPAPTRREGITRFTLRKGQPATILHLPNVLPGAGSPDERFRLAVKRRDAGAVFEQTYTRAEMMRAFNRWDVMPILLSSSNLPAGSYEVIVSRERDPDQELAVLPFEIVREE
jgi:hypothetical protein